jgi:hypothetical protein
MGAPRILIRGTGRRWQVALDPPFNPTSPRCNLRRRPPVGALPANTEVALMATPSHLLKQTTTLTPPRILIHGVAGVGKTNHLQAKSDRPVIIATDEGLGTLDVTLLPAREVLWRRHGGALCFTTSRTVRHR